MEYRTLPHGGEKISVIGLGAGSLSGTKDEMVAILNIDTILFSLVPVSLFSLILVLPFSFAL